MYEALLKATPEYQKIAASFALKIFVTKVLYANIYETFE